MNQEELKKYDFIVLVDKSGSMDEPNRAGSKQTRWEHAQEACLQMARECMKYDDNGITVGVFHNKLKLYKNVTDGADQLKKIFQENQPGGGTDTALAVKTVIDEYLASKAKDATTAKPIIVVILTDGIPEDEAALVKVIVDASKKITSREEIGLEFIQVGDDAHAKEFLNRLDNDLTKEGAALDIVNCTDCDELGDKLASDVLIASLTE